MKQEQQLLYKIMHHFEGMQKVKVFDLLHRIEVLLFYAQSPLQTDDLKRIITAEMDPQRATDPFGFTILANGNFCELEGTNDWIHIYKEVKRGLGRCNPIATYYFKTKYAPLALLKLTKSNLLDSVANSPEEYKIKQFLQSHRITKKDRITEKLLVLNL